MLNTIAGYLPTVFVGALVVLAVAAAAAKILRDKMKGQGGCGCHCAGCPNAGACHTKE